MHFIFHSLFQRFKCTCSLLLAPHCCCFLFCTGSHSNQTLDPVLALALAIVRRAWILLYPYLRRYESIQFYWWLEKRVLLFSFMSQYTMFNIIFYSSKVYKHNSKSECLGHKWTMGREERETTTAITKTITMTTTTTKTAATEATRTQRRRRQRNREKIPKVYTHTQNLYRIGSTKEV